MGQEVRCAVEYNGRCGEGKAYLETDALLFRGEFRLSIPLRNVEAVQAQGGDLVVVSPDGTAVFSLGSQAERWAERIRNPKSLHDKLGVPAGARVAVIGVADEAFWVGLRARTQNIVDGPPEDQMNLIFVGAEDAQALKQVSFLREHLAPDGTLWVIRPRGSKAITERAVMAAGRAAGLVDVKVVRFSDTHTAEKFVIPRASRP